MSNKPSIKPKPQKRPSIAPKAHFPKPKAAAIPDTWPGAFEAFKIVRPSVKRILWTVIGTVGLYIVANIIIRAIFSRLPLVGSVIIYVGDALFEAVIISLYFAALRNHDISLSKALNNGVSKLLVMFVVLFVTGILSAVSLLALIVPFFFVFPRLVLAPFLVIDQNLDIGDAISTSWNLTKGHSGKVWGIVGIELLLVLLSLTIIGIPFAIYWGAINYGSFALLAMYLTKGHEATASVKAAPSGPLTA